LKIKDLDKLLVSWGRFWAEREALQGYASTSVTERCCQVMRTGIWASSDKHLFSHQADQLYVPDWVAAIDSSISQLDDISINRRHLSRELQRAAITRRYIKNQRLVGLQRVALMHAQAQLLAVV
tara:strand:+ start:3477 stop:3848 length:372 start_codon:yes stop_codon:yes gene_type:complete